jgi:hypothetical protein
MKRAETFRRVAEIVRGLGELLEPFAYDDVTAPEQAAIAQCLAAFALAAKSAERVAEALSKDGQPPC